MQGFTVWGLGSGLRVQSLGVIQVFGLGFRVLRLGQGSLQAAVFKQWGATL